MNITTGSDNIALGYAASSAGQARKKPDEEKKSQVMHQQLLTHVLEMNERLLDYALEPEETSVSRIKPFILGIAVSALTGLAGLGYFIWS